MLASAALLLLALGCVPPVQQKPTVAWSLESAECTEGIGGMDMAFIFKLKLRNVSKEARSEGVLFVRSQDPSRPLPHQSTSVDFEVPGGLHPSEAGETQCWVPCSRLARYPSTKLDDGCKMQVSVDEKKWLTLAIIEFKKDKSGTSDPLFKSLFENDFDRSGNPVNKK
jgi:hypothetical protein